MYICSIGKLDIFPYFKTLLLVWVFTTCSPKTHNSTMARGIKFSIPLWIVKNIVDSVTFGFKIILCN